MPIATTPTHSVFLCERLMRARCEDCGIDAGVATPVAVSAHVLSLGTLVEILDGAQPDEPECPSCGAHMEAVAHGVFLVPDEPGLPALGWVDDTDSGVRGWRLVPGGRPEPDRPIALLAAEEFEDLGEDLSEDDLRHRWGRPVAIRAAWWSLFHEADVRPGALLGGEIAPGLSICCVKLPEAPEEAQRLRTEINERAKVEYLMPVNIYGSPGRSFQEWAGPWSDAIAEHRLLAMWRLDATALVDAMRHAATSAGLIETDSPIDLAALPAGAERYVPEGDGWWFATPAGPPVWVAMREVLNGVLADALSLYEAVTSAAQRARSRSVSVAHAVARLAGEERIGDVRHVCGHLTVFTVDGVEGTLNMESLLDRAGWDPHSDAFTEILRIVSDSSAGMADCSCGEITLVAHLRQGSFRTDPSLGALGREITDERGARFLLMPTHDCPHRASFLSAERAAELYPGDIWEHVEGDLDRARFTGTVEIVRGFDDDARGAILTGPNLATLLAHPALSARLLDDLEARAGLVGPMLAIAYTTDCLLVMPDREECIEAVDLALRMQLRESAGHVRGTTLGYVTTLERTEEPRGSVVLAEPAPAAPPA